MTIISLACGTHKPQHEHCSVAGCVCHCHATRPVLGGGDPEARARAREAANLALLEFTTNPDLTRTEMAIKALTEYEQHLKEARRGR